MLPVCIVRSKSPIPIPNTFNEEMRKQQLMEIKKKFKSKKFWGDSSKLKM